jgi:hypothetical protein
MSAAGARCCSLDLVPFGPGDASRWFRYLGPAGHPVLGYDRYPVRVQDGQVELSPFAMMAVGVYVVVDDDDRCRYVGKVTRSEPGGIRDRFCGHHAATDCWSSVWLLAMRDDSQDRMVRNIETQLIAAYRPDGNVQQVNADLRAARRGDQR